MFSSKGVSEVCHFCREKVYLMEKISAEGLVLHRSCLKCVHCHTNLRLGGYAFDRDSPDGLFYCTQHFRLPLKTAKPSSKQPRLMVRERKGKSTIAHNWNCLLDDYQNLAQRYCNIIEKRLIKSKLS